MRRWIDLVEAWVATLTSDIDDTIHHDVFINPSRGDIARMIRSSRNGEVRALVNCDTVYVWDADLNIHYQVADDLKLSGEWARIFIDRNGPFMSDADPIAWDESRKQELAKMIELVHSNTLLTRFYGTNFELPLR